MDATFDAFNASRRTTALAVTAGLHVLLIAGLVLGTARVTAPKLFNPPDVTYLEDPLPADEELLPPPPDVIYTPEEVIPADPVIDFGQGTAGEGAITPVRPPTRPVDIRPVQPVRVAARPDARLLASGRWKPGMPASVQREARRAGEIGSTVIRCVVDVKGRCESAEVLEASPIPRLDEAAVRHAERVWRFTPATDDGTAVRSTYDTRIRWQVTD